MSILLLLPSKNPVKSPRNPKRYMIHGQPPGPVLHIPPVHGVVVAVLLPVVVLLPLLPLLPLVVALPLVVVLHGNLHGELSISDHFHSFK